MLSTSFDAGIDPKIVSNRVGHANMNVTLQIYTHRSPGHDRAAAELIAGLIQAAMDGETAAGRAKQPQPEQRYYYCPTSGTESPPDGLRAYI